MQINHYMNNRVIFMHIPKCGGTTFNSILDRMYTNDDTYHMSKENIKHFNSLSIEKKEKIKLLRGGHFKFGLHKYFSTKTEYITFLRSPIDRIISNYFHVKRDSTHRFHSYVNSGISLYDYVIHINKEGLINNGQTKFIAGIQDNEHLMLEKALENIKHYFSFIGLVEKFDESLIILQEMYNWPTPYYNILNKTKNRPKYKDIDRKTIELIQELNAVDIALYNEISKSLDERFQNERKLYVRLGWFKIKQRVLKKIPGMIGIL